MACCRNGNERQHLTGRIGDVRRAELNQRRYEFTEVSGRAVGAHKEHLAAKFGPADGSRLTAHHPA